MSSNDLSPELKAFLDKLGFFGWQLGLERIEKLCSYLGDPHLSYPTVHIAGTNGKGSVAAMMASISMAAGLRTGLYTSPHLYRVNERIQIDGKPVDSKLFEEVLLNLRPQVERHSATYFEAMTAAAFAIFKQQGVELAIIETGLGGRYDATNVVKPEVAIITSIGLEHQEFLGPRLIDIVREKSGIVKEGTPCVSGVRQAMSIWHLRQHCQSMQAEFYDSLHSIRTREVTTQLQESSMRWRAIPWEWEWHTTSIALPGLHQIDNAKQAIVAALVLRERGYPITPAIIAQGLGSVRWPARFQLIGRTPEIVVDAAHNLDGFRSLIKNLEYLLPNKRVVVTMALLQDKPLRRILGLWRDVKAAFHFAPAPTERSRSAEELVEQAREVDLAATAHPSPDLAFEAARQDCQNNDVLCITGSHYFLGALIDTGHLTDPYSPAV